MSTTQLSAQEEERVVVFQYADSFPLIAEDDVIAYIVNPSNGRIVVEARTLDDAIRPILNFGMIGYAVGTLPDPNGEDPYWTSVRLQRLFDHNRRAYVTGLL